MTFQTKRKKDPTVNTVGRPCKLTELLYELFRTRHMLDLMDAYSSGEMSHRISEDLKIIKIPVPDQTTIQETIIDEMNILRNEARTLKKKRSNYVKMHN